MASDKYWHRDEQISNWVRNTLLAIILATTLTVNDFGREAATTLALSLSFILAFAWWTYGPRAGRLASQLVAAGVFIGLLAAITIMLLVRQ